MSHSCARTQIIHDALRSLSRKKPQLVPCTPNWSAHIPAGAHSRLSMQLTSRQASPPRIFWHSKVGCNLQ